MPDSLQPMDCTAQQAPLSCTVSWSLLKLMSIESMMPPTILSSAALFSFYLQFFPASGSFPMSRLFASGGQSTGASALASVLLVNIQGRFSLGLGLPWGSKVKASACKGTDWFDLAVQGTPWTLLQHYKLCMYP